MEVAGFALAAAAYNDNRTIGTIFIGIAVLYYLASLVPSISVTVRRLHDIDMSGWWYFVQFVPVIGGNLVARPDVHRRYAGPESVGARSESTRQRGNLNRLVVLRHPEVHARSASLEGPVIPSVGAKRRSRGTASDVSH